MMTLSIQQKHMLVKLNEKHKTVIILTLMKIIRIYISLLSFYNLIITGRNVW